jgi:hypothetical protein
MLHPAIPPWNGSKAAEKAEVIGPFLKDLSNQNCRKEMTTSPGATPAFLQVLG